MSGGDAQRELMVERSEAGHKDTASVCSRPSPHRVRVPGLAAYLRVCQERPREHEIGNRGDVLRARWTSERRVVSFGDVSIARRPRDAVRSDWDKPMCLHRSDMQGFAWGTEINEGSVSSVRYGSKLDNNRHVGRRSAMVFAPSSCPPGAATQLTWPVAVRCRRKTGTSTRSQRLSVGRLNILHAFTYKPAREAETKQEIQRSLSSVRGLMTMWVVRGCRTHRIVGRSLLKVARVSSWRRWTEILFRLLGIASLL